MSWSISFTARNKTAAIELTRRDRHLPDLIRLLIVDAIRNACVPDDTPFVVEGTGHQAEGRESYPVTNCNLTIKPLAFTTV